jgi:hypothetical protein
MLRAPSHLRVTAAHRSNWSQRLGERVQLSKPRAHKLEDPQSCIRDGRAATPRPHTIFIRMEDSECQCWVPVSVEVKRDSEIDMSLKLPGDVQVESLDLTEHLKHKITGIFHRSYSASRSPYCSLSIPQQGTGSWAAFDIQPVIDDRGLRAAGETLTTPIGVSLLTPSYPAVPNCLFQSQWQQDQSSFEVPLQERQRVCSCWWREVHFLSAAV